MYLWAVNRAPEQGACQQYRIKTPMKWLAKLGHMRCYEDKGRGGEDDVAAMMTSDIDLFYSMIGRGTYHQMRVLHDMKPGGIQDGTVHYPPTIIWDCDDNQDYVHPFNTAFCTLGVRHYPSGDFLEPGESLEWEDANHNRKMLWEDGVTQSGDQVFNIKQNIVEMKIRHMIQREADGVTVPSPALASYVKNVVGQRNVYVFPNSIDLAEYDEYPTQRDSSRVRILWQGGQSHFPDLYPLRDAIVEVARKYPQTTWIMWGELFDWITDAIPHNQLERHGWSDHAAYKLKRGLIRADINLCPIADNAFNRCKSDIKWLEASIWSTPEATLAADVAPYHDISDGKSGLLYSTPEEFVQKLSRLIEDAELRRRLGEGAKKWVLANRLPEHTVPGLFDFYVETRRIARGGAGKVKPATIADLKRVKEKVS